MGWGCGMCDDSTMSTAICDPRAFYPLRGLVSGPFHDVAELGAIERLVRAIVLHDEIAMEFVPLPYDPEGDIEPSEEEVQAGGRNVIVAFGPVLTGYDFFSDTYDLRSVPEIDLTPALIQVASRHANAGEGNVYFTAHTDCLKRVLKVVQGGGSVLMEDTFWQDAVRTAQRYPESLFQHLDEEWKRYARHAEEDGFGLLVPPVLGIVLTRCARRGAIPAVIRELRDEWASPRRKVWELLAALRVCGTVGEAEEIRDELSAASRLFAPRASDLDSRPVRVFWEILTGGGVGAIIGQLSGGHPVVGAVTGALTRVPPVAGLVHEFGPALFGRGAFDLARRVQRAVAQVERDALPRLLTDAERQSLGFR